MTKGLILASAFACAAAAADEGGNVAGPVTGFVLDGRTNSIRPIDGLPGAARLGAAVRLPFAVAHAAIASRQDYALVVPASAAVPMIVSGLRSGRPAVAALEGAIEPTSIALAASGAAALFHSAAVRRLQFVEGLPSAPRALDPIDTPLEIVAAAIDSAGAAALLADSTGQIWRASRGNPTLIPVARLHGAVSLSFLAGRDAALAVSAESGEVMLFDHLSGTMSIRSVATIPGARAVQALDGRAAGVVTLNGRLATADLDTGAVEWIPLAAEAESFAALDRSLFILNRAGDHPLLLLDCARERSAWFVPPEPARPGPHRYPAARGEDRH